MLLYAPPQRERCRFVWQLCLTVIFSCHPIGLPVWQSATNCLFEYKQGLKQFFYFYVEIMKNIYYIDLELQEQKTWLAESSKKIVKFLPSKS